MVEIEDKRTRSSVTNILEEVFRMGQNDLQPQHLPSVSVGDVIEYGISADRYWMVMPTGFKMLSAQEFNNLNPPTSSYAYEQGIKKTCTE